MLYAILVEGAGPWGSVFSRDDFTDREVQDTDGDGLPEFVDAWGQPLQFFRWPVLYHSELQRGQVILPDPTNANTWDLLPPYQTFNSANTTVNAQGGSPFLERERDPLDPNQTADGSEVVGSRTVLGQVAANDSSPFTGYSPAGSVSASGGVQAFEYFFHRLTEPVAPGPQGTILGPRRDLRTPGFLFQVSDPFGRTRPAARCLSLCRFRYGRAGRQRSFLSDRQREQCHAICPGHVWWRADGLHERGHDPARIVGTISVRSRTSSSGDPTHPSTYDLQQAAKDDISNHNLQAVSRDRGLGMINSSRTQSSEAGTRAVGHGWRRLRVGRRGFTLIELLVVILIILLVSAVALPVVLPALSHRQVSEAARLLQGALAGRGIRRSQNGTPSGIRLLPDPAFPAGLSTPPTAQIDPTQPLAANRIIPDRSGARVLGRDAVGRRYLDRHHSECSLPADQRRRKLPDRHRQHP